VFATVVKTSTIRLVLLLAAARDYNLSSIDIRQAYLQSLLNPNVPLYMRPPPMPYLIYATTLLIPHVFPVSRLYLGEYLA